ncbi:MAG: 6-carboxytetrahydropterin synthase [Thermodesulfobacteriota bacterium]
MERIFLTKVFNFSASHKLFIEGLTEEENMKLFDKCANPNGHGHDYKVEVMISSGISEYTGMIVKREVIEEGITEIKDSLDYKRIDQEIEFFKKYQSTVENIAIFVWDKLFVKFNNTLKYIKVWENERSYFEYYREEIR